MFLSWLVVVIAVDQSHDYCSDLPTTARDIRKKTPHSHLGFSRRASVGNKFVTSDCKSWMPFRDVLGCMQPRAAAGCTLPCTRSCGYNSRLKSNGAPPSVGWRMSQHVITHTTTIARTSISANHDIASSYYHYNSSEPSAYNHHITDNS